MILKSGHLRYRPNRLAFTCYLLFRLDASHWESRIRSGPISVMETVSDLRQ